MGWLCCYTTFTTPRELINTLKNDKYASIKSRSHELRDMEDAAIKYEQAQALLCLLSPCWLMFGSCITLGACAAKLSLDCIISPILSSIGSCCILYGAGEGFEYMAKENTRCIQKQTFLSGREEIENVHLTV